MPARARRALIAAGALLTFLVLAGATYQGVATALERRQFPHPGRLVDVGGHQLHLYCSGEGAPTVVLEAPAAGMSAAWGWVQPRLAETTRVCSYDRAGLGWSEAGDRVFAPALVVEELRALMERAGEPRPFVLVGHGLGAAFATLYASRFGGDVAALVLIDAPSPTGESARQAPTVQLVRMSPWLARAGVLRATRMLSDNARGLPEPAAGALSGFLNRPDHLTRSARELARWNQIAEMAAAAPLGNHVKVVRINATGPDHVAFLTDREQATIVSVAISGVLAGTRSVR
jgi:pimeloyl-ACP methyl ester carboxylesterase